MQNVNYIKHLNALFYQFSKDNRLNPSHISLYMALFQFWNIHHFTLRFYINRAEVMQLAKLGSKSTYHRCIKELSQWKYITYLPSHNPYKGSEIIMINFETSVKQVLGHKSSQKETSNVQDLVPKYKHIQTIETKTNRNNLKLKNKKGFYRENDKSGKETTENTVSYQDNLKVSKNKNYNEPL